MSVHDDLLALCRDMHTAGESLTYAKLRARRGGGSRRDIAQALRAWQQENPEIPAAVAGRPSKTETHLREIILRQRETIREHEEEIRILKEETVLLARMVRKYRGYPEDEQDFEDPV